MTREPFVFAFPEYKDRDQDLVAEPFPQARLLFTDHRTEYNSIFHAIQKYHNPAYELPADATCVLAAIVDKNGVDVPLHTIHDQGDDGDADDQPATGEAVEGLPGADEPRRPEPKRRHGDRGGRKLSRQQKAMKNLPHVYANEPE